MTNSGSILATQIAAQLKANKSLNPSGPWLETCLSTQRPATPSTALYQTALFRILASDITASLEPIHSACLPQDVHDVSIRDRRLLGPIVVQILDVEDLSKSRWEQIEAIEALERGEGTKGREIVRVVVTEEGDGPSTGSIKSNGPHKLLLQDTKGVKVYGIELSDIGDISLSMNIGCKLALKSVTMARGVVLMEPTTTTVLGGKIEALHKDWKQNRKAQLKAAIEAQENAAS
ncbi:hypothetical protein MMC13_003865 [Lambiella insularis]|nr:hypothetical protein [Lambiella insularis]